MRIVDLRSEPVGQSTHAGDVFGSGSAASANHVDQAFFEERSHLLYHHFGCLVVFSHAVGEPRIGMHRDETGSFLGKDAQQRQHILGAKRAVETHAEGLCMCHTDQESLQSLPAERASGLVVDRHTEHQRHLHARLTCSLAECVDAGFGIQRVENGLHEHSIHTALEQGDELLQIGSSQLVERYAAESRVIHIRTHGASLVGGPDAGHNEARPVGCGEFVSHRPCQTHGSLIDFLHQMFAMIISQRDALTAECIGADDVCSGLQITPVDIGYHIGAGEREHIIVALHLPLDVGKQIAPEILLLQPIRLNHSAHGTIKYQYVAERLFQSARGILPFAYLLLVIYLAHSLLFSLSPL